MEYFNKVVRSNHGVTFREQAIIWLNQMKHRKRRPVAPSTLATWESCLNNWLNPNIGDLPLDSIKNLVLKSIGTTMVAGGLGASAIRAYTNVVKMVVASAVDEQGEQLHPRKWNHEFIDLPVVKNPKQPSFTGDVVTRIVATPKEKRRVFFALCAAAGLRFGETLGIDIKNISRDCTTIKIKQKVWRNQVHDFLKNEENGHREIDLHSSVAAMLREFIGERKTGLLFCSRTGKPLQQSNILRRWLHPVLKQLNWKDPESGCTTTGSHAFRRFRNTYLRNFTSTPPSLVKFWLGHAGQDMSDLYDKAKNDVQFRKAVAERAGLGFELPAEKSVVGLNGPKIEDEVVLEMAASV